MIRRTFLKALAALPFIGKMPVQGRIGPAVPYVNLAEFDKVIAQVRRYMIMQGINNIEGDETSLRPFPCQPTDT